MVRKAVFAGSFYPSDKAELENSVKSYIASAKVNTESVPNAVAYVAPHAGYIYSGRTAGHTYKAISMNNIASTTVIIGPNHTGVGTRISVSMEDWETPLGEVKIDKEFAKQICSNSEIAAIDESAHASEHSIEVQLPFMQSIGIKEGFVFVCMGDQSIDAAKDLANSILKTEAQLGKGCTIIASSDFNHYESADIGKGKDMKLIRALETLDYKEFNNLVMDTDDSICGYGAITTAAIFAEQKGTRRCMLLDYSNSGFESNDFDSVVDYASLVFL